MALTLAQAAELSRVDLQTGIVETIIEEGGALIDRIPFEEADGITFNYTQETTLPTMSWLDVNEDIPESSGTYTQVAVTVKKLLGDEYLDKMIAKTRGATPVSAANLEADIVTRAVKSATRNFLDAMLYGNKDPVTSKMPDGMWHLVDSTQIIKAPSSSYGTPATGSLAKLDQLIDKIKPGLPDLLIMSRQTRRALNQASRATAVAGYLTYERDSFGKRITMYDGIPVFVNDFISDVESLDNSTGAFSAKTGGTGTSIWAVKFGSAITGGFFGIQASQPFEVERLTSMEKKDSIQFRVKWYVAFGCSQINKLAVYTGLSSTTFGA